MTSSVNDATVGLFYHGTRADLKAGDLIAPGFVSNYGRRKKASWVYLTATLDVSFVEIGCGGPSMPSAPTGR
jgi:rifampin ADP-ribosylating transferase